MRLEAWKICGIRKKYHKSLGTYNGHNWVLKYVKCYIWQSVTLFSGGFKGSGRLWADVYSQLFFSHKLLRYPLLRRTESWTPTTDVDYPWPKNRLIMFLPQFVHDQYTYEGALLSK